MIVKVYVQDKSEARRARIYIRQTEVESSTVYSNKIRFRLYVHRVHYRDHLVPLLRVHKCSS